MEASTAVKVYWIVFVVIYLIVFFIDFYVTDHRKGELTVPKALRWTGVCISIALLFGASLFFFFPQNPGADGNTAHVMGIKFISGYLTEYSLSIDNLFVFIMIFSLMNVPEKNQPKLLKLGILLSIVLRILFILVGMELVQKFEWIIYIFGLILLWTAYKMAFTAEDEQIDPQNNFLYKLGSKLFPVDPDFSHPHFFSKIDGKRHITMFALVFLVIGSTDVLFAVDSIPAIIGVIKEGAANVLTPDEEQFLAITSNCNIIQKKQLFPDEEQLLAITSNVFAVMGLISLYFALKGIMGMFRYLKHGVSFILAFIGLKMLLPSIKFINEGAGHAIENFFASRSWLSLTVIVSTLVISIILSVIIKEKKDKGKEENNISN